MNELVHDVAYQDLLEQISRTYTTGRTVALQAVNTQLVKPTGMWGGRLWSSSRAAEIGQSTVPG